MNHQPGRPRRTHRQRKGSTHRQLKDWIWRHGILVTVGASLLAVASVSTIAGFATLNRRPAAADEFTSLTPADNLLPPLASGTDELPLPASGTEELSHPEAETARAPVLITNTIGTPVQDGMFEFTVVTVECGLQQVGTDLYKKKAKGQYCLATVIARNAGDQPQELNGSVQYLHDTRHRKFQADSEVLYLPGNRDLFEPLTPGAEVRGQIAYDLPLDAEPDVVELHGSLFSKGARVSIR